MSDYQPLLPQGLPADLKVDTADPRYKAAVEFARANKFSQDQFSALLGVEAKGVLVKRAAQSPPAPAAPAKPYAKMSFAERIQLGEARRNGGR